MNIVDLSIKRPIMVAMGIIALVFFGLLAYFTIPVNLMPNMTIPVVTIQTVYAGASPQVIETQISKKIEDQVSSISGLKQVTSYSLESVAVVVAEFQFGTDENKNLQEVKDKVELIQGQLPKDAEKPAITKVDMSSWSPVMSVVLDGDMDPTELYTFASTTVNDRLSQVDGVGSVQISGGQEREIRVELDRSTVFARSVPVEQIAGILASANVEIPGGNLTIADQDLPVRLKGEFSSLDSIRDLDVPTPNGVFKLRQLADVKDAGKTVRERTILVDKVAGTRNENALLVQVIKNPSSNTIEVVQNVNKQIEKIKKEMGNKIRFKVISEDATFVKDSVDDVLGNIYMGILFTGIVLLFFLHDLRSTIIVTLAMPFSILSTFLIMKVTGLTLNVLTLMGLSSSIGTLVANSVVVLENIFRYKELGHDRGESASKGTKEVVIAVFASTLTNIAVFLPLANMSGIMGQVLSNFAYTIVIATIFSIVVSFTLTPLLASRILPTKVKREGKLSLALEGMFKSWEHAYERSLRFILKRRRRSAAVVLGVVVVFIGSMYLFKFVKFELFPATDGGKINVAVELPQGSSLDATAAVLAEVEKRAEAYPEVMSTLTTLGTMGSLNNDVSVAQMRIFLVPRDKRADNISQMAARFIRSFADVPGATIRVSAISEMGEGGSPVDLYLTGLDNEVLRDQSDKVLAALNTVPGLINVSSTSKSGKAELVFDPDRKKLSESGLTVQNIAVALRAAVDGLVTTTYKEGGEEYDIRVSLKDSALLDLEDLKNIPIVSTKGTFPLSRYAELRFDSGYNRIMRTNKIRTVEFTADLLPGYTQGAVVGAVNAATAKLDLPLGYEIKQAGSSEELGNTVRDLLMVFVIAVVLTYMLLAATLESVTQPLFILATVPLSLIGVVAFALPLGTVLNIVAMLGIIMLVGIVVNNAILMLDYYNQLRRSGKNPHDALVEACPTKLKPILMSNIAIILGMLPMALGIGASGAEMRQPMGVVIIGGIVSSTMLTLWIIPALEYAVARERKGKAAAESAVVKE